MTLSSILKPYYRTLSPETKRLQHGRCYRERIQITHLLESCSCRSRYGHRYFGFCLFAHCMFTSTRCFISYLHGLLSDFEVLDQIFDIPPY
jgi:hypothetical protein